MDYITIQNPPSSYIPYPEGSVIRCRPIKWGDAWFFAENRENDIDVIRKFAEDEIIKCEGFEFWDLTVGDWLFLLLSIMSSSFMRITYNVERQCPHCKGEIKTIDLQVPNAPKMEVKGNLKADLTPSDIVFKQIDRSDVEDTPVIVELTDGNEAEVDFYRMRHYVKALNRENTDDLSNIVKGVDTSQLSMEDIQTITYAREVMDHGPENEVDAVCPLCSNKDTIRVDWEGVDFVPFRVNEESARSRIRFGKGAKSTNDERKGDNVSSNNKSIPGLNKVSGEDATENEE